MSPCKVVYLLRYIGSQARETRHLKTEKTRQMKKLNKTERQELATQVMIELEGGRWPEISGYELTAIFGVIRGDLYDASTNSPGHRTLSELASAEICHYGKGRHRASLLPRYRATENEIATHSERAEILARGCHASRERRVAATIEEHDKQEQIMIACFWRWARFLRDA